MLAVSLVALVAAGNAFAAELYSEDKTVQKALWETYKRDFGKEYVTESVESEHFDHFLGNLKEIDALNAQEDITSIHGLTSLSDHNFGLYSSSDALVPSFDLKKESVSDLHHERELSSCSVSRTSVDWSTTQATAVKSMGYCLGAHWAFSVVSQLESDAMRRGENYVLSPQQLLQCVTSNNGCSATPLGAAAYAFNYAKNEHGIHLNNEYAYVSSNGYVGGQCRANDGNSQNEMVKVSGYYTNLAFNEECMANHVQNIGPLAVCISVNNVYTFAMYTGGIIRASTCSSSGHRGHLRSLHGNRGGGSSSSSSVICMQIVGLHNEGSNPYWKVRGSFGTLWGEGGYARIEYGTNACSIAQNPIYSTVDVQGEF